MHATRTFSIVTLCLILLAGFPGVLAPAAAQQQEKRIALVLGNGAYAKSPLATAANDAGLIAQTLQAAGFDVVGARDLDGDTLRRSFRDFIQKAEASGPGTVAMVYLAGYGMQLAGENYFIPVDSALGRDVDIPIEGLRISDYVRQLASLPLKASIVVLDAARQQPFIAGGQPIASGLALVEPEARMLVAFNAAPGTVAPNEPGPYGAYAQSLAEMIRTGGLPLPEVFNRVRLRVNEASKGAQVPWNADKIDAPFMFFDRATDAPAPAPADQAAAVRNRPMRELGVRDAYAAALERDTMQGYEDFLVAYPGDPLAKRVRAIIAARREAITWLRSYRADTPQAYWSYLRRYPRGPHASDARRRLAILTAPLEPPPAFAVIEYDVPPPPQEEIIYVDRPVLILGDPEFDFVPPPPPPLFFLPPPPPDFVILAPPPPPVGLFILPQPFFVPIPVYVRAPVYVAPPPNNIIFTNIHNTTVINTVINQPPQPPPAAPAGRGDPAALPNAAAPPSAARGGAGPGVPPVGAGPALPAAAAQKASLIQQGKLPVPPSASINPAIKPAAPGVSPGQQAPTAPTPANVPANALPPAPPKANALPVPGTKGAPPAPPSARGPAPGVPNPSAKGAPANQPAPPPAAATPGAPGAPVAGAPKPPLTNAPAPVGQPKAGGAAQAPEPKPAAPEAARRPNAAAPPPLPPPSGPAAAPSRPIPQAAPKPPVEPPVRRAEPP
ncbi:MAG TPA: caspase family protein, partial [Xanthobacteraceae bacterium]